MRGGCSARLRRQRVHGDGANAKFDADRGAYGDGCSAYRLATNSDARTVAHDDRDTYAYSHSANSDART